MREKVKAVIEVEEGCIDEFTIKLMNLIRFPDALERSEEITNAVKEALRKAGCSVEVKVK